MMQTILAIFGLCSHPETHLRRFSDGTFFVCWTCGYRERVASLRKVADGQGRGRA